MPVSSTARRAIPFRLARIAEDWQAALERYGWIVLISARLRRVGSRRGRFPGPRCSVRERLDLGAASDPRR